VRAFMLGTDLADRQQSTKVRLTPGVKSQAGPRVTPLETLRMETGGYKRGIIRTSTMSRMLHRSILPCPRPPSIPCYRIDDAPPEEHLQVVEVPSLAGMWRGFGLSRLIFLELVW